MFYYNNYTKVIKKLILPTLIRLKNIKFAKITVLGLSTDDYIILQKPDSEV